MAKESSEALFDLIQRMNKSEKRFFKLFAGRQNTGDGKFIRLFDRLSKMKVYDENLLLELEPTLSRKQLPNQKIFLYDYLLRCLRLSNSADSADLEIAELSGNARVLYNKCLYADAIRLLDKAKRIAAKYDRYVQLPELLDLEKELIRHTVKGDYAGRVSATVHNAQEVLKHLDTVNRFQNLSIGLNVFYVQKGFIRDRSDLLQAEKYFHKNLPKYEERKLSPHEKLYLYQAQTGYYFFIQDFRNGYRYAQRWVKLFEDNPQMCFNHTEMYIRALNSLLVVLNKTGRLEEFERIHRKLVAIKREVKMHLSENENLNLFKAIYIHEINRHFMRGEFRSGVRIVARLENELNRFIPLLDHHSLLLFYYKIACLYFGADQFRRSLFWLNKIIQARDIEVREDLHTFARILALICHFEQGNDRLAEAHIVSLYRFMLKKGHVSAYHRLIIGFLRKLHRGLVPKKLNLLFRELKEALLPLTNKRFEKRAFYYFDIISWLESKIENKPVEELIKVKNRAGEKISRKAE